MQKVLSSLRKAVQTYNMIENGDKISVGVSGGKDSLILLESLVRLRNFIGFDYEIIALSVDAAFNGTPANFSKITEYCNKLGIIHHIISTHIGEIVFDIRMEKSPCSLCARMRRGALNNSAAELGCNKLALGHNSDDAAETFIMNLFTEGRIGCFSPVTLLEDKNLTIIRPLILTPEKEIRKAVKTSNLPILISNCPAAGHTNRQKTKELLTALEKNNHGIKSRIVGAIKRDIWV